jgi:hypothetical protein
MFRRNLLSPSSGCKTTIKKDVAYSSETSILYEITWPTAAIFKVQDHHEDEGNRWRPCTELSNIDVSEIC